MVTQCFWQNSVRLAVVVPGRILYVHWQWSNIYENYVLHSTHNTIMHIMYTILCTICKIKQQQKFKKISTKFSHKPLSLNKSRSEN